MEKTWTVVTFKDENVVEAVPTNWIINGRCYWPPYTTEKILKAIKDHVDFDSSWTTYEVYVFKNSTSESYQACRLKAKKAEDTSDLNSDYHTKRIIKKKRTIYESDSSELDNEFNDTMLSSPPDLKEYSDTEIQTLKKESSRTGKLNTRVGENRTQKDMRCDSFNKNNVSDTSDIKEKSCMCNKENRIPLEMCRTRKENKSVGEKYDDSSNNIVPGPLNRNVYTSNIQQRYSQKDVNMHRYNASCSTNADKRTNNANYSTSADKQTDNTNLCTCCPIHKNNDEKFRRMFKELFLLREVTKECCEDIKVTFLRRENADKTDETESTFLSTFHFPLRRLEELNEVEEYLQKPNHFQSTAKELSKMGGTAPYDFVKRCLSLLLSNRFAEQYSWYGAKKKQVFGKLFLAKVLQESALLCKAAENRKEVEKAIKTWLRRAKERAEKEEK